MKKYSVFYDLNSPVFGLMELTINNDGLITINGQTFDIEELKQRILKKQIRTNLPINSRFRIHGIGYNFLVDEETYLPINESEFIKEVSDMIKRIKGKATSADKCMASFKKFLIDPSSELLRQKLEDDYNSVPTHNRIYILGDMDSKDNPLCWAIDKTKVKDKKTIDRHYQEYFGKYEN